MQVDYVSPSLVKIANETFANWVQYDPVDGQWITDNIGLLIESLSAYSPGTDVDIAEHVSKLFGQQYVEVVMSKLLSYISGEFGPLAASFETVDHVPVTVTSWEKYDTKCYANGKIVPLSDVFIVLRRKHD